MFKEICFFAFACGLLLAKPSMARADFLGTVIGGHLDIAVGFHEGALEPHMHSDTSLTRFNDSALAADVEYEAGAFWLGIGDVAKRSRSEGFATSTFDFLGVNVGQDFWFLPENNTSGLPRIGFSTDELSGADWGNVTFTLNRITPVSGTAHFSAWQFDGSGAIQVVSTTLATPGSFSLAPEEHDHWNMAFSGEGVFNVEFTFSATKKSDNQLYTATEAFTFAVGNANFQAVPEPSSLALVGVGVFGAAIRFARRRQAKTSADR